MSSFRPKQKEVLFLCTLTLATFAIISPAYAVFDDELTLNNNSFIDYTLTSVSSTDVFGGSLPSNDPTLNLYVGKRYRITIVNPTSHPFEVIALGADSSTDDTLLIQGAGTGSLESDLDIDWQDLGGGIIEFTLTSNLVTQMRASGKTPGYRCGNHPASMRGNFSVFGAGAPITDPVPDIQKGTATVELELIASGMPAPLGLADPNDGTERFFIYDQAGQVLILQNGSLLGTPLLDVSSRLVTLGILSTFDENDYDERGLLGLALHPNFTTNGKLYTYTSEPVSGPADFTVTLSSGSMNHQSVIAEWTIDSGNSNIVDISTRREILRIDQPQFNHNGGEIQFGPDDLLYIALGDGGSADDEAVGHGDAGNGQDPETILGTILRIDVDGNASTNGQYTVPEDNSFVGISGIDEIYAYGFRNPFRFGFDHLGDGTLYVGDVGQNHIEEIDVITNGGNYGWRLKEGTFYFDPNGGSDGLVVTEPVAPDPGNLIDPIAEYDHDDGIAIVGGYVYRAGAISSLQGLYVFGDFGTGFGSPSGRLFYLNISNQLKEMTLSPTDDPLNLYVKGMGQDSAGNVYLCASDNLGPYGTGGKVYRLTTPPTSVNSWYLFQ